MWSEVKWNQSTGELEIRNPKRKAKYVAGRASWYPYYAGFSVDFVHALIASITEEEEKSLLDPWNGTGTTTTIGAGFGHAVYGYDLNPVMVIVAKARTLSVREKSSLYPITADIISKAKTVQSSSEDDDPLYVWFDADTTFVIRNIERSIQTLLVDETLYGPIVQRNTDCLSDLASFFYTALFRTVRFFSREFLCSNPTWIKKPKSKDERIVALADTILEAFDREVQFMLNGMDDPLLIKANSSTEVTIGTASSDDLPLEDNSIDLVISSPPYCTRIDYAVSTALELALLGYRLHSSFDQLRRKLIGTSTVPKETPEIFLEWGKTCNTLLDQVRIHQSKASGTYYYKNLIQYFASVYSSLKEIKRVLTVSGRCVLVVQDSYYKDIHINLPQIFAEMADSSGLDLERKVDFVLNRTMAGINPGRREYRDTAEAVESVICFTNR